MPLVGVSLGGVPSVSAVILRGPQLTLAGRGLHIMGEDSPGLMVLLEPSSAMQRFASDGERTPNI